MRVTVRASTVPEEGRAAEEIRAATTSARLARAKLQEVEPPDLREQVSRLLADYTCAVLTRRPSLVHRRGVRKVANSRAIIDREPRTGLLLLEYSCLEEH